ncbi:AAA family ATPase [Acrocarpospora sp. B8E8]|uniref:ATP-binding protein n=1 Tax=Acrocarpospora sp. B8E8 TaxID=3153572 RepID=UPI00325FBEF1
MLLDREASLAALAEYAADAERGEGRLVLISGEAGVGKTALVEQFERDLPGARWYWGACDGLFTPRPLGPLFDLADQFGGRLLELARAGAARDDLFSALREGLEEFGVLVIEDVHWADEATVDLLRFLGRRVRHTRGLLLVTYRDDSLPVRHPLRVALGELVGLRTTRRIGLAPLSVNAVAALAEGSGIDTAELYRLTGGNPFFVTDVVRSGLRAVPASARDAVLARVAPLGDAARETLEVAALMGTRIEVGELAALAGEHSIDELVAAGLLGGAPLGFRHEIARLAVAESVAPHRRPGVHARILAALRRLGCDDDARLAHHAEAAGDPDTLEYAQRAARTAVGLASHREAAAQFERALRFASGLEVEALARLHEDYCVQASHCDRGEEATRAGERALALWRSAGNRIREGDTLRRLSRAYWGLSRDEDGRAAAEDAVAVLGPLGESAELAWAYANLACQRMLDRDNAEAVGLGERAREIAGRLDVPDALADALNTIGCAKAALGEEWTADLRRALATALACRLPAQAGRAYANLQSNYVVERRFAEADQCFGEGLAYCLENDIATYVTCLRGGRTVVFEQTGQWAQAAALSAELLAEAASPTNRISPLTSLGIVRARLGQDGVWECLDEAAAAADGCGSPGWIVTVRLARVEAYWLEGKDEAARSQVESLVAVADRLDPWARGAVAVWLRRTGSDRAVTGVVAETYRLMMTGDRQRAARAWRELNCPFDAALALFDGTGEGELRAALEIFTDLGSVPAARLTRRRMRRLGIRSVPVGARVATREHPLGLTRREREVLELIHAGRTDAEIAAALVISVKTVGHHVSAVLAKLGAPTRAKAASEASRLGLFAER